MKYNDEAYKEIMIMLIDEVFYTDSKYYDKRISAIREYAEIILRRLLKLKTEYMVTLGDHKIRSRLNKEGFTETIFVESLETITKHGNDRSHTKKLSLATKEEYEEVINALFNLYAYLFYKYFEKYRFGSNQQIVSHFSLLPPSLRYITLNELFQKEPDNDALYSPFVKSIVKAYDLLQAIEWIEENAERLKAIPNELTPMQIARSICTIGVEETDRYLSMLPENKYECCMSEVQLLAPGYHAYKARYTDFEGALSLYRQIGPVLGDTEDVNEFNALMEFVYCGRKEQIKEIDKIPEENYIISFDIKHN